MTDKLIYTIYADATNYTDPDAFASDWATSSAVLDPEDPFSEIDPVLVEHLHTLWHIANDPFRDLLALLGLNQTQCSVRFCIPLRTVQDWAAGRRTPPPYLRLMMAEIAGLVKLRDPA